MCNNLVISLGGVELTVLQDTYIMHTVTIYLKYMQSLSAVTNNKILCFSYKVFFVEASH